ncbi:hypothetical protein [Peribacillus sp. NPDC097225]|uniref:hypothetical protein n=1 Tax=Peribacillus sp. NPDC097225 TaxID=3364400 RepID=UPI0037FD28F3
MGKKKAIKLATATAIAASAFVAVAPTQSEAATSSVDKAITKATKQMAKAYDTYHKAAKNDGELPATGTIRNQTALAKDYYDKAKAEIAKNGGSKAKKTAYTKQLDGKKYFLDRAQAYVNAVNTNLKPAQTNFTKAVEAGKAKQVLTAQTVLNKDIASFEGKVAKIYGPDARNLLLKKYAAPAQKLADSVNEEMKVYNAYKQIENGFLIEKDVKKAGELIESVKAEVAKLKAKNTKLAKSLLAAVEKNNAAYEKANSPAVSKITAVNATTVELTYKENVKDVEAKDFSIEGLTVTNAVVKQTDDKTVILTTSTQVGGKEYTVKAGEEKLGLFTGISAVIPTAVKVTTPSIQGTIGKEVTVKATVTVPEGQSKAGIPVTINIPESNSLNKAITAEVYTDANGEAAYSYTRYSAVNDNVVVYATGDRSKFSTATVYFAQGLAVSEVTAGNTLANGSKKVYKVTGTPGSTVNVTFKENVQVTPDKLVTGAKIEDAKISILNADGTLTAVTNPKTQYPYEVTTGGSQVALVKLNEQGTATFTVTGTNATVTPIVFADGSYDINNKWTGNGKLGATELQATAPAVTFALSQTIGLNVKAEGVQNAAANTAKGEGGRDYTVTITDKDGKIAPAGTTAYVVFPQGSFSKGKNVQLKTENEAYYVAEDERIPVQVTGAKGQVTFTLIGDKDAYATPTVYLDNGSDNGNGKLDSSDLQVVGEITYFVNAVVTDATLEVKNEAKEEATSVKLNEYATFTYGSKDQNGFKYYAGDGRYEVTYQVSAQFGDVTVRDENGDYLETVAKGTTKSVKVFAVGGIAKITATSNVASTISVEASASQVSLPNKTATIQVVGKASTLERINAATTVNHVLDALNDNSTYKEKLDAISSDNRLVVAQDILDKRPGSGYTQTQLDTAFNTAYNPIAGLTVNGSAKYTAPVPAVTAKAAEVSYTITGTDTLKISGTSAAGAGYNGWKVKFIDNDKLNLDETVTLDNANKQVVLDLANTSSADPTITTKYSDIDSELEKVTGLPLVVTVSAGSTGSVANALVGTTLTLVDGVTGVIAEPAKLTLTFSEALTTTTFANFTTTGTTTITNKSTPSISSDKKTVTITIGGTDSVKVGDSITKVGNYAVSGKTILTPIVIK